MIAENHPPQQIPVEPSERNTTDSYLDWSAIFAGGVLALAISFLLITFGSSLGLSLTSPYRGEGVSAAWLAIAAGIWFVWVTVTSFAAGGYLCGRLRRRVGDATATEVEVRDGAHGLVVWATAALVSTVLAATGVGAVVSTGSSAIGSAAETATEVAAEAVSSDYFANVMLRSSISEPGTGEAASDPTPAADDAETTAPTGATAGQQPARETTQGAGVDPAVQQEIASIIARSAASGEMAERDRSYLAQLVAANSDLDEAAARSRVDEVNAEIDEARQAALDAVERARVTGVVLGFIAAASLLIGAVAALYAATVGGRHRDDGLGLDFEPAQR